ncbi:hypothetical protein HMPREF1550_02664 [Actinomyces sp. oral taxon 877 str. F0543]|nr:hypothetical protein HMPREF1550_02664 [Actinomyces sp. oral taxon 877 str. F0543]
MSHSTCPCCASLGRCDRYDLLVGLEGFHLIAVARREWGLVLDVESCDPVAGCPGCGVIARCHGRVVVEVVDAPWAGAPTRIRWRERRWMCLENTCETGTLHQAEPGGVRPAHPAERPGDRLGHPSAALRRSHHLWAVPPAGNGRGTRCGPTSKPSSPQLLITRPVSQACGCWGPRTRVAPPGLVPQGPQGAHRHHGLDPRTGPSHGPLVGPGARPVEPVIFSVYAG